MSSSTISFAVGFPIARDDLADLCERICSLFQESGADVALCDVSEVRADAVAVDVLARLQLAARRHGCELRLCNGSSELLGLLELMGLRDVLRE